MMRHNLGHKLIAALASLALVAFAITFGVLLSVSTHTDEGATQTVIALMATDTETPTPQPTETERIITPTETTTPTRTLTPTPFPTETNTLTSTVVETAAPTETTTQTSMPTETQTSEPTQTPTSTKTATPSPTWTESHTPTKTITPSPTWTDIPTPTLTCTPAPMRTNTPRPTETGTRVPIFSSTATSLPQDTLGILPTATAAGDETACQIRTDWPTYTVESRATLFMIALAVDSTVDELRDANCLQNIDRIRTGDTLHVPHLPVGPVVTFAPPESTSTTPSAGTTILASIGCTNAAAKITNLVAGQRVTQYTPIVGSATIVNFGYYVLDIRPDGASTYNFYARSDTPVTDGVLGHLDVMAFGEGVYWLRLSVFNTNGQISPGATCAIPLRLE